MKPPKTARYHVKAWYSWQDVHEGRYAIDQDYKTRDEALAAATASDCPLIDVSAQGRGIIADRELLRHPQMAPGLWTPRDTLGAPAPALSPEEKR